MNHCLRLSFSVLLFLTLGACTTSQRLRATAAGGPRSTLVETRRDALAQALADADQASRQDLRNAEARGRYNQAVVKAVASWMALTEETTRGRPLACGEADHAFSLKASWPTNLLFDQFIPAQDIKSHEMKRRITRDGVGAPFVAWWKYSEERAKKEPFMTQAGYLSPVTATLTFRAAPNGGRAASLVFHDPRTVEDVIVAGGSHPLSEDITAVGEFLLSRDEVRMSGLGALLRSGNHMDKLGLISLEHPAKDRTPVIFVHGLMSRPATWQNVVNELWSDPLLQRSCQFYFFRYPTGVPVIYSAAKLRERLGVLHNELEREGDHTSSHHMVLIGHSMGGLVSKSQVQDSGDRLWVNIFGSTPDKLQLSQQELEALRAYLEYKPNPYVSRVIFVATPHRGSELADGTLGAIGRKLVSLPGHIIGDTFSVLKDQGPQSGPLHDLLAKGVPTSIDNLSPKSPYVQTSINLPMRPGLHIHSIIGNKKQKPLTDPKCSDGFVPYTSAHLDGVESELIVPFGHSAHEHPQAVEEMRRILHLHLGELSTKN